MVRWFRLLTLAGALAVFAACGDDEGGSDSGDDFCELGELDCGCHPSFGCREGLTCTETGCVDCDATPDLCRPTSDGGT